jgi:hypothetical protein
LGDESEKAPESRLEDKDMTVHGGLGRRVAEEGKKGIAFGGLRQGEGRGGGELGSEGL